MGGDQLVAAIVGEDVDSERGDRIRESEKRLDAELIDEVRPFDGAHELLEALAERGHAIVLASSAKQEETERYVEMLGAGELLEAYTTSADVEQTKPAPDLVAVAMQKAGELSAVMLGDSTWDVEAAARAELKTVAVLTGGFSEDELLGAGAVAVFESLVELRERLATTPLR